VRFCKQHDNYSCGAVAVLNIAKFCGHHATYQDLKYYQDLVKCQKGTFSGNISKVLGSASRRSWKQSKEFLCAGNCILILTAEKHWGHFFLIATDQYGCFITINRYHGIGCPSALQILPHAVARLLKCAKLTWYVEKRNDNGNYRVAVTSKKAKRAKEDYLTQLLFGVR